MTQFFIDESSISGQSVVIKGDNYNHLTRSRRIRKGEVLFLRTEKGTSLEVKVVKIGDDEIEASIVKRYEYDTGSFDLILCVSLLKGNSFESVLQKSVEVGVSKIIPVVTERTIPDIKNKVDSKFMRWEKIIFEAAKQSMAPHVPSLLNPVSYGELVKSDFNGERILAEPSAEIQFRNYSRDRSKPSGAMVLIGPEGGFSNDELSSASGAGWELVGFGKNHFRAETAAVVIPAIILNEWS